MSNGSSGDKPAENPHYKRWARIQTLTVLWLLAGLTLFGLDFSQVVDVVPGAAIPALGIPILLLVITLPDFMGWIVAGPSQYRNTRNKLHQEGPQQGSWLMEDLIEREPVFKRVCETWSEPDEWSKVRGSSALRWGARLEFVPYLGALVGARSFVDTEIGEDKILESEVRTLVEILSSSKLYVGSPEFDQARKKARRRNEELRSRGRVYAEIVSINNSNRNRYESLQAEVKGQELLQTAISPPDPEECFVDRSIDSLQDLKHEQQQVGEILDQVADLGEDCVDWARRLSQEFERSPPSPPAFHVEGPGVEHLKAALSRYEEAVGEWREKTAAWDEANQVYEDLAGKWKAARQTTGTEIKTQADELWPFNDIQDPTVENLTDWASAATKVLDLLEESLEIHEEVTVRARVANSLQPTSLREPPTLSLEKKRVEGLVEELSTYCSGQEVDRWLDQVEAWEDADEAYTDLAREWETAQEAQETQIQCEVDTLWPFGERLSPTVDSFERWTGQATEARDLLQDGIDKHRELLRTWEKTTDRAEFPPSISPPKLSVSKSKIEPVTDQLSDFLSKADDWEAYLEAWRQAVGARTRAREAYQKLDTDTHDPALSIRKVLTEHSVLPGEDVEEPNLARQELEVAEETYDQIAQALDEVNERSQKFQDRVDALESVRDEYGSDADAFEPPAWPPFEPSRHDPETIEATLQDWKEHTKPILDKLQDLTQIQRVHDNLGEAIDSHQDGRESWSIDQVPWEPLPPEIEEAATDLLLQGTPEAGELLDDLAERVEEFISTSLQIREEVEEQFEEIQQDLRRCRELAEQHNEPYAWTDRIQGVQIQGTLRVEEVEQRRKSALQLRETLENLDKDYEATNRAGEHLDDVVRILDADHPYSEWRDEAVEALRDVQPGRLDQILADLAQAQSDLLQDEIENLDRHRRASEDFVSNVGSAISEGVPETLQEELTDRLEDLEAVWSEERSPTDKLQEYVERVRQVEASLETVKELYLSEARYYKIQVRRQDLPSATENDLLFHIRQFSRHVEDGEFAEAMTMRNQLRLEMTNEIFTDEMDSQVLHDLAQRISRRKMSRAGRGS